MKRKNYGSNCSLLSGCLCSQSVWILESCIVCADRQPVIFVPSFGEKGKRTLKESAFL